MTAEDPAPYLEQALSRSPDSVWIRRDLALLGWGEAMRIDAGTGADRFDRAMRALDDSTFPLAMASFAFDEEEAASVVVVPRTLLRIDPSGARFLTGAGEDLPGLSVLPELPFGRLIDDGVGPWEQLVAAALQAIRQSEVEKVVISRRVQALFDAPLPMHRVLGNLARSEPDSHTFLVDRFLGSSPELLVSLFGRQVHSISLAGSVDPIDPEASRQLGAEKTIREHSLAADSVEDALSPFCSSLRRSPSRAANYGQIRHLSTTFDGEALPGTLVTDLLGSLHPTAAVAGTPTKPALELIRELEGRGRGRYSGPVGWFDRSGEGEFAIALRCASIEDSAAILYAGAGIVEGSSPRAEFEETTLKLRPMLGALGLS